MDNENTQETTQEVKTYTQEEVDKLLQSEADRRVTDALNKQKKKYEKEISLSKLTEEERVKAESEARIAELEEQLREFQKEKNKSELKTILASRGISAEFVDFLLIDDEPKAALENLDKFEKVFNNAVKAEVERRLAGNIPQGNGSRNGGLTKEQFDKLSLFEQRQLLMQNKDYEQFLKN